jgi:hypothetical protein
MKAQNAVLLALVALGAAHLVQRERHQWQQNEATVMRNQLDWLTHLTTHPELAELWAPEDLPAGEYTKLLHANQQICALSLRHKLGLLRGRRLRFAADWVMEREHCRRYWERFGAFREAEADGDGLLDDFTTVMHDAYTRASRREPQPAGV